MERLMWVSCQAGGLFGHLSHPLKAGRTQSMHAPLPPTSTLRVVKTGCMLLVTPGMLAPDRSHSGLPALAACSLAQSCPCYCMPPSHGDKGAHIQTQASTLAFGSWLMVQARRTMSWTKTGTVSPTCGRLEGGR